MHIYLRNRRGTTGKAQRAESPSTIFRAYGASIGQRTEIRGQKSEGEGQKLEDRNQRSEVRSQRTEDPGEMESFT
jgi:hypothetical protein